MRIQMPAPGAKAAFAGLFVTHAGFQVFPQQVQAGTGFGAQGDPAALVGFSDRWLASAEIDFVEHPGDTDVFRHAIFDIQVIVVATLVVQQQQQPPLIQLVLIGKETLAGGEQFNAVHLPADQILKFVPVGLIIDTPINE